MRAAVPRHGGCRVGPPVQAECQAVGRAMRRAKRRSVGFMWLLGQENVKAIPLDHVIRACDSGKYMKLVTFSTDDLPERTRVQDARDFMMDAVGSDIRPVGAGPFYNHSSMRQMRGTAVGLIDQSAIAGTRLKPHARRRDDNLEFSLMIEGTTHFNSPVSGDCAAEAGEALLLLGDVPGTGTMTSASRRAYVDIPYRIVQEAGVDVQAISTLPCSPELSFLSQYAAWISNPDLDVPEAAEATLANHLADLVLLALHAKGDAAEVARGRGLMAARLNAVKADIRTHLADGHLRLEDVARRQGISPSYIRALFERQGGSFTDFLVSERLLLARRKLASPRSLNRSVAEIAYSCGFNDLSYFNRAFKRRFGLTPREVRIGDVESA